jgi:hypothetical protein
LFVLVLATFLLCLFNNYKGVSRPWSQPKLLHKIHVIRKTFRVFNGF